MKYDELLKGESIFVTGGTGFIGSHLCRRLLGEGASVSVLAQKHFSIDLIRDISDKIKIYHANITDLHSLQDILKESRPNLIFHFAANVNVGRGLELIKSLIDTNVLGTINMLYASREAESVKKFVFLGTSDVYGTGEPPYSENNPAANPVSSYGASKAAAELFCRQLAEEYKIPWVVLRPFIVYGGGQTPNMFIPKMILSVLSGKKFPMTGGEQTRDFLYVEDFVDACIKAGLRKEAEGETINIASGKETPIADVAKSVMSLLDNTEYIHLGALPYRENERWHVKADISKAGRLLGWKPETALKEGLKKTIHWHQNKKEGLS